MMYACLECGDFRCEHRESKCKRCCEATIRTMRIKDRHLQDGSIRKVQDLLEPGESIESSWFDEEENEHVFVVKRHIN